MKKITFILFALIAGTAFGQNSVDGTATINAVIVSPLTISSSGSLNFGTFTTSVNDATILISADGSTKTFSETDMELPGDTHAVPTFIVTKHNDLEYNLIL